MTGGTLQGCESDIHPRQSFPSLNRTYPEDIRGSAYRVFTFTVVSDRKQGTVHCSEGTIERDGGGARDTKICGKNKI